MEITDDCEMMLDDGRAQIDDECKLTVKWSQATWIRMSVPIIGDHDDYVMNPVDLKILQLG
ncbi:hypothetical protein GN958_ATG13455 [Phytophthora infestans]|uniref:Uncharacterized protein n=1 Tax=Phytophthora infestans TaxID=4787 RepID=A0A8S9U8E7_PHYIN|nr:hypothetical protein GN958_ATG13455 [Phytophthora infestans]